MLIRAAEGADILRRTNFVFSYEFERLAWEKVNLIILYFSMAVGEYYTGQAAAEDMKTHC